MTPGESLQEQARAAGVADDVEHPLDPRFLLLERMVCWIVTAAVSLGLLVAAGVALLPPGVPLLLRAGAFAGWAAVTLLLVWWSLVWPDLYHRHAAYRVSERGIEIRRGVWWRRVITVPRSRVQHTDVSQGPLERRFGLATLAVHTAGTENAMVGLHGLERSVALRIRDHLVAGGEDDGV